MPKYRPYSCTMTSAATFEAPKTECVERSIDMPIGDAAEPLVVLGQLPARLELDEGKIVGAVAVDLVRRGEDEGRVGAWSRAAWRRFRVPTALTPKSVSGSRAAQSWDGCAAVWMTSSIREPCSREHARRPPSRSRMSRSTARNALPSSLGQTRGRGRRRRLVAEEVRPHVVVDADDVEALRSRSTRADSEPIRPPEPVMSATGVVIARRAGPAGRGWCRTGSACLLPATSGGRRGNPSRPAPPTRRPSVH